MVAIKPKRPAVPVPFLQGPIDEILTAQSEKALTHVLEKFDAPHHFERPEERYLLNWYKVLNRFDDLLDRYVSERNIFAKPSSSKQPDKSAPSEKAKSDAATHTHVASDFPLSPSRPEPFDVSDGDKTPAKRDSETEKNSLVFSPSPSLIRLVLRVTQRLIRNASHDTRNLYNSIEHLGALLADEHSAIVLLTLEILNMLMQRSHKMRSTRPQITFELSERLLDLAVGWGGRENRLGLLECCSSKDPELLSSDGSRLCFEYSKSKSPSSSPTTQRSDERRERQPGTGPAENAGKKSILQITPRDSSAPIPLSLAGTNADIPPDAEPEVTTSGGVTTIIIDNVGAFHGTERSLLLDFALRHHVPKNKLFSLLCAFRRAKGFSQGRDARIELAVVRLYALTTLFQLQPVPSKLSDLLAKEPELTQDVMVLARASSRDGVQDVPRCLRSIAIRCMTAMCTDRHRVALILSTNGINVHHGALPTLLRTEIAFLMSSSNDLQGITDKILPDAASTESGSEPITGSSSGRKNTAGALTLFSECNRGSAGVQRIHMIESLLTLVHTLAVAAGASGATPLANSGVLASLIPLLTDADPHHARVVSHAIRAMQAIVEGSAQTLGSQLFRDHDGLALVAERIAFEVGLDDSDDSDVERGRRDEAVEVDALQRRGESRALYERLGRRQMTPLEALEHPPPSSSTASRGLLPHSKWALIRTLHQLLLRALGNGGNEVRELVVGSKLPRALRKIMSQPFLHGGSLFQLAANVTTEIAHAEPTATAELVKTGLASTVLETISLGLPPCGEAVRCIPNLLAALCLAPTARDVIVNSKPLKLYLLRLATPFYTRALHGETPVLIGSALDELMRHVEALRPDGNEAMIEYLRLSAKFVETDTKCFKRSVRSSSAYGNVGRANSHPNDDNSTPMDKGNSSLVHPVSTRGDQERNSPDVVLLDRMKLAVANNSCRLAGFAQGSSEHQQGIVQNGGLDHMIQLRCAPALASTEASIREGCSASRHFPTPAMTVGSLVTALKNFSSRHAASVLKSVFTVILKDAATVLKIAKELDDRWLPQEDHQVSTKSTVQCYDDANAEPRMMQGSQSQPDSSFRTRNHKRAEGPLNVGKCGSDVVARVASTGKKGAGESDGRRSHLRKKMGEALKKLRVGVVLLTRLPRGGSGTSAGVWELARGSQVAAIVSTVERAARYHLAVVYTGLTLSASSDGDLSTARVTAAADPEMKAMRAELCTESVGDLSKVLSPAICTSSVFVEACKRYRVPPEGHAPIRQDVKGLAWCLVTFAVAAQRLYSILSKGLTYSSRRLSRDPVRYAASAKSLAGTIGRIFALHLMAAVPLWEINVITMGRNRVVAAWDYVRGILIEIKGTLFDEGHRVTQSLILKSFLDAGGADALMQAARPLSIVQAAAPAHVCDAGGSASVRLNDKDLLRLDKLLKNKSISVASYLLALRDVFDQLPDLNSLDITRNAPIAAPSSESEKEDTVMSSDSVSNQARAISRIVVSESEFRQDCQSVVLAEDLLKSDDLVSVLANTNESTWNTLKQQTNRLSDIAIAHCENVAIQRVASDVWNTLCGFLHLLGSCPGLLNSNSSPIPEPTGTQNGWEPRDIQRSALTVTVQLVTTVTSHPAEFLAAFRPDATATGDLLGIIHTTSQVAGELCQTKDVGQGRDNLAEGPEAFLERQEDPASARRGLPDPDMMRSLMEMGFSERRAAYALRRTAPGGIEYAAEWLLSHREGEGDSDGAEEPRDWDDGTDNQDNHAAGGADADDDDGDGDDEDDDGDAAENDGEGEDEDGSNENDDGRVVRGEPADNSGQTSDAADDAMEDAAHAGASESGDIARRTLSGDTSPRPASVERRSRGRTSSRLKQKGRRLKSLEAKSKEVTLNVAADKDGRCLLQFSLKHELTLLSTAIEKSKIVPSSEIEAYRSLAAAHVGPIASNVKSVTEDSLKGNDASVRTIATSVDSFRVSKKLLFESLLDVTKSVIHGCEEHIHGRHLPYLAIELLSIIQKDGSLVGEGPSEFVGLLGNGLRLAWDEHQDNEKVLSGLSGQTAAIWSHYGGNSARRALQACGAFRLAYDCLMQTVGDWGGSGSAPLVDVEATQPIKNLSITEDDRQLRLASDVIRKGKHSEAKHVEEVCVTKTSALRPVTETEAVRLKQLTTCLMLLDASVRFEAMDKVIECCREADHRKGDGSGQNDMGPESKPAEKMDTDEHPDTDGTENEGGDLSDGLRMNVGEASKTLHDVMRDIFGPASSAMEIDAKAVEEADVDLETVRSAAKETKVKLVNEAKKEVSHWMTTKAGDAVSTGFPKEPLVVTCLTLLKLWRGLEVGDALLAVLQLLASLTADWDLAQIAIDGGVISTLVRLPQLEADQSRSTDFRVVRLLTKAILRHLIEDPETLQEAMVAELRSLFSSSQSRARPAYSLKTIISTTSPMVVRDLQCFVSALTTTVRACESERRAELQLVDYKILSSIEIAPILERRPNIRDVVATVSALLTNTVDGVNGEMVSRYSKLDIRKNGGLGLAKYALELLANFVEVSQVAAVAFIKTPSPSPEVPGSALDYIIQKLLPLPETPEERNGVSLSMSRLAPEREEVSSAARNLFLALCSRTANTHEEAIAALARAAKREADKREACPAIVTGLAECIAPGTKLRVLRVVLQSDLANDLARSLRSLDLNVERNFEVASSVLRALSLVGQAATYLAQHGDDTADDAPFGTSSSRDPWSSLREREDVLGHSGSFMVL